MHASDLAYLSALVARHAAITLDHMRPAQISARLTPVARRFGFRNPAALMRELPHGHGQLVQAVIEAMTTNDTWFFRDRVVFDHFRDCLLPTLLARRRATRSLRIWCAAASTGQEAYTLAMILAEKNLIAEGWTIEIIASDISAACIARARDGLYSDEEVQRGLGVKRLITHFAQESPGWRISPALRQMVRFQPFNLLEDFAWLGELDLIVCRNVLFYFEPRTKLQMLERLAAQLAPDGFLLTGTAELPHHITPAFEPLPEGRGVYCKPDPDYRRTSFH